MGRFGVHAQPDAARAAQPPGLVQERLRDDAFGVVAQDQGVGALQRFVQGGQEAGGGFVVQVAGGFAVHAHDLLAMGDDAGLDAGERGRGRPEGRSSRRRPARAIGGAGRPRRRCPQTPSNSVAARKWARLRATLPAPPGMKLSRSNSTTGTGASGEMRATLPQRNWSSITSPSTVTRARPAAASNWRTRESGRFLVMVMARKNAGQASLARKAVRGLVGLAADCGEGRPIS